VCSSDLEIKSLTKPSKSSLADFRREISELAKSHEEYNELFKTDKEITNFVRKNVGIDSIAIDKFLDKQLDAGFNLQQLAYIKALLVFIRENGKFEIDDLLREELDFRKIFNNIEISNLIDAVFECL
jgi:hypothetical protein